MNRIGLRGLSNGWLLAVVLMTVVVLAPLGCSSESEPKVYSDPDVPVVVRVGESFVLSVPDNPDSGYMWDAEFDESSLQLVSDELVFAEDRECEVCAWGTYQFVFTAVGEGESVIVVTLRRPLEADDIALQHLFNVTVTPR